MAGPGRTPDRIGKQVMRQLFVLVPSLIPTAPIKGAVALCNALASDFNVTLVALKRSAEFPGFVNPRIRQIRLGGAGGWRAYRRLLEDAGGRATTLSLSLCFSADVANFRVRRHAVTVASIRGHLPRTYRIDYGPAGRLLAFLHYFLIARLDRVVAMTDHMAEEFKAITGMTPLVIGNFVDEGQLEPLRMPRPPVVSQQTPLPSELRYVFVGRLDPLKNPGQVIDAVRSLTAQGIACSLDIFGDGPLMAKLGSQVAAQGCEKYVRFHGYVASPWQLAAGADCLVLPSMTEGVSRAAMEALYLGIPCVMRDVDSNADLIRPGENGTLFSDDSVLCEAMKQTALLGRRLSATRPVLLTDSFREATCVASFREVLQKL
jgi:glycosyltransferase involved in cell wall biosynthesis